eukprot:UN21348
MYTHTSMRKYKYIYPRICPKKSSFYLVIIYDIHNEKFVSKSRISCRRSLQF